MDKAQTDIPVDIKINNESNVDENNTNNKTTIDSATKDEIQLADILKPSTLIIALATLVLLVLFGWYIYVLKPALNDNESMIHLMESATHQKNTTETAIPSSKKNVEEKALLQVSNVSQPAVLNASKDSISEVSSSSEKNMIAGNEVTKNKNAKSKKHKIRKHRKALKPTVIAQRSSSFNQVECTQAQIVLQQCPLN